MKVILLLLISCFITLNPFAQTNLVFNSSFENGENKGFGAKEIKGKAKEVYSWRVPVKNAPDLYMTPTKSVAVANSGRNAIGLVLGSSRQEKTKYEYITGKLTEPLVEGQTYCISFSTILHRTSKWAATDMGIVLHNEEHLLSKISDPSTLSASVYANDGDAITNTKWSEFSGYYVATGGELFISFGKFGDGPSVELKTLEQESYFELDGFQSKAYYQLDDVKVTAFSPEMDCGCAEPIPTEEDEEIINKRKQPPYLFALDASGSMKSDGLFDTLRSNLVRFVEGVPFGTPVSFVTFAASSKKVFAGAVKSNTAKTVDSLLSRASIGGGTNVYVGLQLAYESWDEPSPDSAKIILISDGAFNVTNNIVKLVKEQYEIKGRKLTIIQIGARAPGLELLKPYMDDYIHTTASELKQVVAQLNRKKRRGAGIAVNCECTEEFSDTMNYHFVIDYSGSMKDEKTRAIFAVRSMFGQVPDNAMVSFTVFDTQAKQIYVGKKTDITMARLTALLSTQFAGGGTNPTPGVADALVLAKSMSENRFSHIVLITDLPPIILSRYQDMRDGISHTAEQIDMAAHAFMVSEGGFVATYAQFDLSAQRFVGVFKSKFENDLFKTSTSSCNYTSQKYHYNPAKAAMRGGTKRVAGKVLRGVVRSQLGI